MYAQNECSASAIVQQRDNQSIEFQRVFQSRKGRGRGDGAGGGIRHVIIQLYLFLFKNICSILQFYGTYYRTLTQNLKIFLRILIHSWMIQKHTGIYGNRHFKHHCSTLKFCHIQIEFECNVNDSSSFFLKNVSASRSHLRSEYSKKWLQIRQAKQYKNN